MVANGRGPGQKTVLRRTALIGQNPAVTPCPRKRVMGGLSGPLQLLPLSRGGTTDGAGLGPQLLSSLSPPEMSLQEEAQRIQQLQAITAREQYLRYQSIGPMDKSHREMAYVIQRFHCVVASGNSYSRILRLALMMVHGRHRTKGSWSLNPTLLRRTLSLAAHLNGFTHAMLRSDHWLLFPQDGSCFVVFCIRRLDHQLPVLAHQVACGYNGHAPRNHG